MIALPNNCSCSEPSVHPKNWKTTSASVKRDWYIQYYFRDFPANPEKPSGELVIVKRMNKFKTLPERRAITKIILEDEIKKLKDGYNPLTLNGKRVAQQDGEITKSTGFIAALRGVYEKLNCVATTKSDIRSTIKFVEIAAVDLQYDTIRISEIERMHIKNILTYCDENKKVFTAKTFNRYRKNLGILFKELVELGAAKTNVIRDISRRTTIRKIKRVLTPEECKKINDYTREHYRRFYLLINIFFHSGGRTTELFRVKLKHVDIEKQSVLITVLKGNQPFEVEKPIKNIAVEFWKEAIEGARPEDFIFAKGLVPGPVSINPRQATRRWRMHIKKKLGIVCNWYNLKDLNTDQIAKEKGLRLASFLNSHTNTNTTRLYAVGEDERMNEEVKKIANKFG